MLTRNDIKHLYWCQALTQFTTIHKKTRSQRQRMRTRFLHVYKILVYFQNSLRTWHSYRLFRTNIDPINPITPAINTA